MSEIRPEFAHMVETPTPRASNVRVVRPAPKSRAEVRDAAREASIMARDRKRDDHFQMPQMPPTDLVVMPHLRQQRRQTSVISAKVPPQPRKEPVVRERPSVGLYAGANVDQIIER